MMQGFGVHTFRLINEAGEAVFCKFHRQPTLGTHSLVWDEAVKIAGADADYHRRDLWEAIEAGAYPEYALEVQIFTEADAERLSFDVLDPTKIIPEELVPLRRVGRMVLNRNPDNFFAETEQVAFCVAHVVPGIDFSNDPLLQGRIFSYLDTQLSRLGGANFHEIPINSPLASIANHQRDGMHRQAIARGRVAYEPNSLGGGCPFQAGMKGFVPFPEPIAADKLRGKPDRFADHYTQARLFWESQTPVERQHITNAFRFELTRIQSNAVRTRMIALLANVAAPLATAVASGLGMSVPDALPPANATPAVPEIARSAALSRLARAGDGGIRTRRIAILVAPGVDATSVGSIYHALADAGANPRLVGAQLGTISTDSGELAVESTMETAPAVLFDALVLADGIDLDAFSGDGVAINFIQDQYRHGKAILAIGDAMDLLEAANVPAGLLDERADPGLITAMPDELDRAIEQFTTAVARHRHPEREAMPPPV